MYRLIAIALLLNLSVGAFGNECSPGFKHKKDLTNLKCIGLATDAKSCNSECCETDKAKCGGLTPKCAWDSYEDTTTAGKNTAATEKNKDTNCCKKKATCSQVTCPAGKKKVTANAKVLCIGDAASCALNAQCCETDSQTCGGSTLACSANRGKYIATKGGPTSNAWKAIKMTAANQAAFNTACCSALATCAKATCPAGQKNFDAKCTPGNAACQPAGTCATSCPVTTAANQCKDKAGAVSADPKDCSRDQLGDAVPADPNKKDNPCCIANKATCGGAAAATTANTVVGSGYTCPAGQTASGTGGAWNGKATTASDQAKFNTNCCTKVATCKQYACPSGYIKNKGNDAVACTGNVASCTAATCCKDDTKTCGGLKSSGIVCKYGFFDESEFWTSKTTKAVKDEWNNKAANSTNKNINCCTLREACRVPTGTTTPAAVAAVVTTTPVIPVLKFSEHKVTVEEGSDHTWGNNMVWLGVGGVIGMGVLMVVQVLRTKMTAAPQAEGEDAEALLDTLE